MGSGGITTVLIPEENRKDLAEIPENVKQGLERFLTPLNQDRVVILRPLRWSGPSASPAAGHGDRQQCRKSSLPIS